jgi:hypothetical protein
LDDDFKARYLKDVPNARFKKAPKRKITQAERVIDKFGGARRLATILTAMGKKTDYSTIYKWTYPKIKRGTGGLIPSHMWADIYLAARLEGVVLTKEDTDPREMDRLDYVGRYW